jgi:hypothetical protein
MHSKKAVQKTNIREQFIRLIRRPSLLPYTWGDGKQKLSINLSKGLMAAKPDWISFVVGWRTACACQEGFCYSMREQ